MFHVRACVVALAVPPLLAIACGLAVGIAERSGVPLFAAVPPANLAEAAAVGRADDVVLRLRRGEDPRAVYDLRAEFISSAVLKATPAEAAMWSRQLLLIQLLDREGVLGGGAHRHELACLAADLEIEDVVAYLSPGGPPACAPQQARDRVLARTAAVSD